MEPPILSRRRLPALFLLGMLPALSATIPLLDVQPGDGRPMAESRHDPTCHGFPHNHLICIQHQASCWASLEVGPQPVVLGAMALAPLPDPVSPCLRDRIAIHHCRAPPAA